MELDYKKVYETTMRELSKKTEQAILFETLAMQIDEDKRELKEKIAKKDLEIAKLKEQLENKELLDSDIQE